MKVQLPMNSFFLISVLSTHLCALADDDVPVVQCDSTDMECFRGLIENFLERTHKGIPEKNIKTIDPLAIPYVYSAHEQYPHENRNMTVTGLKDQDISDFKLDLEKKTSIFTTKANITIVGDFTVKLLRESKAFPGSFEFRATPLVTASYTTELKRDEKGVSHFEIGPETITCKVDIPIKFMYTSTIMHVIETDEDIQKISEETKDEVRAFAFCSIVTEAYKTVIHNIRVYARLFPASAFIKNIDQ